MEIEQLKALKESIERLPNHAMIQPITHYDYLSLVNILISVLEDKK